jgi:hypothetical protein
VTASPGHRHWYATREDTTVQPGGGAGDDGIGTDWVGAVVGAGLGVATGTGLAVVVVDGADGDPVGGAFVPQPTEAGRINVSSSRALVRVLRVGFIAASSTHGIGICHSTFTVVLTRSAVQGTTTRGAGPDGWMTRTLEARSRARFQDARCFSAS